MKACLGTSPFCQRFVCANLKMSGACLRIDIFPDSSTVEHSAVNFQTNVDSALFNGEIGLRKRASWTPVWTHLEGCFLSLTLASNPFRFGLQQCARAFS